MTEQQQQPKPRGRRRLKPRPEPKPGANTLPAFVGMPQLQAAIEELRKELGGESPALERVAEMERRMDMFMTLLEAVQTSMTQLVSRYNVHVNHHNSPIVPERGTVR